MALHPSSTTEPRPAVWQTGKPLPSRERAFMESRFGHDFSRVRVHSGEQAAASARALRARAFTTGDEIVFGAGQYSPETWAGQRLLAHELAHVAQHRRSVADSPTATELAAGTRRNAETEATRAAAAMPLGHVGPITTRVPSHAVLLTGEQETPSNREEEEAGFWGTVGGGLMGEFREDPSFAMIGVDVGVSLVPILDQASDVRDIIAHLYYLIFKRQYDKFMRWLGVVFTLIGLFPEVGSAIKGASKFVIKGVEVAVRHFADLIRPFARIFPEIADLGRLQAFVARHWDGIVAAGMAHWQRTVNRVSRLVAAIPSAVGGRLRIVREGLQRIVDMAPAKLTDAFAWVRAKWDEVLGAVRQRLSPRTQQIYVEGELRTMSSAPEVVRGRRSGVTPEFSASPAPPRSSREATSSAGSTSDDIADVHRAETDYGGRSVSDAAGHTSDEAMSISDEVVAGGGRLDRLEEHHAVFVFVLHAIESRRLGQRGRRATRTAGEGFRQIVDEIFGQVRVRMSRMLHTDLHRALNDILDEMLEPERVLDLVARRGEAAGFGRGRRVVESGGSPAMLRRLQQITEMELVNIVEEAYRRVFAEHPGMVSDEVIEELLMDIERVRRALSRS